MESTDSKTDPEKAAQPPSISNPFEESTDASKQSADTSQQSADTSQESTDASKESTDAKPDPFEE
jgi:hypothetical protein